MKQFAFRWLCAAALVLSTPVLAQQTKPQQPPKPQPATPAAPTARFTGKLSSDPAQFIQDVQLMMAAANNAAAKATAANFQQLWASNKLTATQQGNIVVLSQQMLKLGYKPRPHLEMLFQAVVGGALYHKFSDQQMDEFLDVVTKTVKRDPGPEAAKFISSAAQFLHTKYLYRSRYSTLRVAGGSFSFAYNDQDMPGMAPAPAPAAVETKTPSTAPGGKGALAKKAAPKKRSSDGWDKADLWSGGSGWGDSNDGWGAPAKKAATPAKAGTAAAQAPEPAPAFQPAAYFDNYVAPPTRGPVLLLKDADLVISSNADSATIQKTSGAVVPQTGRFVGYGGKYDWQVSGTPLSAELTTYDFELNKVEFTAEPVTLTYPAVLEAPVKGALSYKSVKKKPGSADSGYPRFISLTNDARIKNIGSNIRYYGGFSLAGGRMLSASLDGSLSRIVVELDGKPKFRAASRAYVLGDSVITADRASVTIFQDKSDSLTHPGVKLRYAKRGELLQLARENGLYKTTPYHDSYHQMEITSEMLTWPIRTPYIDFSILTAKNQVTANFESKEFYTNTRYQQIKSINKLHPLQMIVGYSLENNNVKRFTVQDVAAYRKLQPANVRSAAAGLARDGYVDWNPQTQQITLRPKALHYVGSSRGKKDYDHIAIKSLSPSGKNATLNLQNNDLTVRGVDRFNFSDDSVTVFVKPDSSIIRIQKNRGILFNGTVVASAFVFKGKEFKFDYDGFFIDLAKIDSIIVKGKNSKGSVMKARKATDFTLTNKKKESAGKLYINHPKNKSGRKKLGAYPSFDATTGAYVFFNKPEVLGGAYDTTVYFDIPPFRIDSLNNKNRSAVGFKGTFVSGGIIPDLKTKLILQEDGSLGFVYTLPPDGVPVYGGKGRLFDKVQMSNRGIQGIGDIKYLTSTLNSEQFIFYKDSVVTVGKSGSILPGPLNGTEFTKVTLPPGYQMKWVVKQDSMYLSTQPKGMAMKLYGDQYGFKGTATLTPGGLYGNGGVDGPQSFIRSTQLVFKPTLYTGSKSTLSIKSAEPNKPALTANNVAFTYDVKNGNSAFAREAGDNKASIDLPYSDYKTTLSDGKWDFKKKMVQLKVAPGADSTRSYFFSTRKDQNGLKFRAATGQYDLSRYRLVAGGVPRIAAADAWIEPDSNKVYVLANAQMRTFQNANIVIDTLAKFHKLYKGEITVLSRNAFTGNALYSYKNAAADSFAIKFANFAVDSAAVGVGGKGKKGGLLKKGEAADTPLAPPTVAVATIEAQEKFHLAPRIAYRGGVNMNSKRRGFLFDGQARLRFSKSPAASDWFAVQDSIDPKGVRLRIPEPGTKVADNPLFTGLFASEGTGKVYPLYVGPKQDVTDRNLFQVSGTLAYDQKKGTFTIAKHDLANPNLYEGAVLSFNDSTQELRFRGPLSFINSTKDYTFAASGVGRAKPDSSLYEIDTFMAFDINLPEKAVEAMGQDLGVNTKGAPEALNGSQAELYKLGEFMGSRAVQSYAEKRTKYEPLQKFSPKMLHTIVLNKVDLRWNEKFNAWYSVGKIGLISVGKKDLNALIDGHIEIHKGDNNVDEVILYLEAEPQTWYFLKYSGTALLAKAQHGSFDEIISLKAKGDYNTATQYGFFLGDDQEVQLFLTRFRKDYLREDPKKQRAVVTSAPAGTGNFDLDQDTSKKKKKRGNEPAFDADGMPIEEAPADTKKKKSKKEAVADAGDPTGDEDAKAAPAEDTSKNKEKATEPDPAADPPVDAKQAKKEEERLKKEEEKKKKEEGKKKKNEDDPFGDS